MEGQSISMLIQDTGNLRFARATRSRSFFVGVVDASAVVGKGDAGSGKTTSCGSSGGLPAHGRCRARIRL